MFTCGGAILPGGNKPSGSTIWPFLFCKETQMTSGSYTSWATLQPTTKQAGRQVFRGWYLPTVKWYNSRETGKPSCENIDRGARLNLASQKITEYEKVIEMQISCLLSSRIKIIGTSYCRSQSFVWLHDRDERLYEKLFGAKDLHLSEHCSSRSELCR